MTNRSLKPLARGAGAALLSLALAPAAAGAASGGPSAPSIIGGHDAAAGTWPALVALVSHDNPSAYAGQFCGGTLIAPQWVLTASHCTADNEAADIDVLAGTHTLSSGGTRVPVAEIHQHPSYTPGPELNDVALLKLSSPLTQPTMAIAGPGLEPFWTPGTPAHAAGWGNQSTSPRPEQAIWPDRLSEVDIPLVSDAACGQAWAPDFDGSLMVCAAGAGVDTCQGDSGGPLTVSDVAGRPVLIGDTSFGAACADPDAPGVYAETFAFRSWIDATIGWSRALTADRSPVALPRPAAGSVSAPAFVTLTASGSAPLAISGVRLGGASAGQFALGAQDCSGGGLAIGASCTVELRATPSADADAAAWLVVASDVPGGTTAIPVTSGIAPPDPGPVEPPAPAPIPDPLPAPPAPVQPAPQTPPTIVVKQAPKATLASARRKGATRRLSVRLAGAGSVTITVKSRGRRPLTVATASARFAKAGTKVVALRLTPKGRALLRADGRIAATATARVAVAGATTTTASLKLTLR
ncbi:serine protease [Conexibacter sp. JD483]|uniref:serine protease n=1 Tax=unclassified Conexibacter TaxID=2627773 RepID=UPI00271AC870|nr:MULTISPECIES: serine protease [unclassified Conexibacter]MDO8188338.1 serine protease [Conexibacter sp. CPCC 205706]MDO8200714.1 serine protease [Conexibacter sp. CPCC 205762]MDR9369438.1 serine protease [Conexibacter sp. JD483]